MIKNVDLTWDGKDQTQGPGYLIWPIHTFFNFLLPRVTGGRKNN